VTNRFGVGARLFHWLVVLLLLVQIPAGIAMIAPGLEQGSIDVLFVLHKGLGVVLLLVVVARVLWRLTYSAPTMSEAIPERERRIATVMHGVIYGVLVVVAGSGAAEDHFALGNLLYQTGDLSAARERFYVAIELADDYIEARLNLGCVLVELNEPDLAEAAYRGALDCHPDYADVHYHLARLLDQLGRCNEALNHWAHFRDLTPESPWAEEAQDRLSAVE